MAQTEAHGLHVVEINSSPFAGGLTAARAIVDNFPDSTIYYDATQALPFLAEYVWEASPEMAWAENFQFQSALAKIGHAALLDLVSGATESELARSQMALDNDEAQLIAEKLWASENVQSALFGGMRRRIEQARNNDTETLIIKGANVQRHTEVLEGVQLLQRLFLTCDPIEAAWRVCDNHGVDVASEPGVRLFKDWLVTFRRMPSMEAGTWRARPQLEVGAMALWPDDWPVAETIALLHDRGADIDALGLRSRARLEEEDYLEFNKHINSYELAEAGLATGAQLLLDTAPFRIEDEDALLGQLAMEEVVLDLFDAAKKASLVE